MILLDTDIMIDLLRQYPPALSWLIFLRDEEIFLPGFVVMELIQGARNKEEQKRIEEALEGFSIIWPSPEICDEALKTFANFHLSYNLGILDVLIGQMAVALNSPLYTFNQKHYKAIPDLSILQPYKKSL